MWFSNILFNKLGLLGLYNIKLKNNMPITIPVLLAILVLILIKITMSKRHKGKLNTKIKCPHCGELKKVYTKTVIFSKGISGGKATGAILTGGISLLVTGLSRKEELTQATCENCSSTWCY